MLKTEKLLSGFYRVSNGTFFSNVKRERDGEFKGKWSADIRVSISGELRQYAGIWNSKREAVEEVSRLLSTVQYS